MEKIINLQNINKTFYSQKDKFFSFKRKKIDIFKNLSASFKKGEIVALLGPNGAGKTTIFKMISTLLLPNEGKILVNGYDPSLDPIQIRKMVSFINSEERSFYFRLTGYQNLSFFATLCDLKREEAKKRIRFMESLLKLEDHTNIRYQEYSTGLKQKLNLARGLIRNFSILLLDEPIKSVDPQASTIIMNYIKDTLVKREGKTVILTTHNIREIENYADRFLIINKGVVLADFKQEMLKNNSLETTYKSYLT